MNKDKNSSLFASVSAYARAFIPSKVSNKKVIQCFELLRKQQRFFRVSRNRNEQKNMLALASHRESIRKAHGMIEDQHSYKDVAYGVVNISFSGCEVIALYNTLVFLSHQASFPLNEWEEDPVINFGQLISRMEEDGIVLTGRAGTSPKALLDYLNQSGFTTEFSWNTEEFDEIAARHDCSILTFYNNGKDFMDQIHTVCITKRAGAAGRPSFWYTVHNMYCNGHVPRSAPTVSRLMDQASRGKAKMISLIGVSLPA